MSPDVPAGAAILLDFISGPESGGRYDVIFGHHESELSTPITSMTIEQLLSAQIGWGRKWQSSTKPRPIFAASDIVDAGKRDPEGSSNICASFAPKSLPDGQHVLR